MGISEFPDLLQGPENNLDSKLPGRVSKSVPENLSDKETTSTTTKHKQSLSGGDLLFRNVTLRPVSGSAVRKWKRKKMSFVCFLVSESWF